MDDVSTFDRIKNFSGTFWFRVRSFSEYAELKTQFQYVSKDRQRWLLDEAPISVVMELADRCPRLEGHFPQSHRPDLTEASFCARPARATKVSVVIPHFNNWDRLRLALRGWGQCRGDFELIVVDDGSDEFHLPQFMEEYPGWRWARLSRDEHRRRGGRGYRAGRARNLGALCAAGERLIFADSDILVPPDFIERILEESKRADILMPKRWQLRIEAGKRSWTSIDLAADTLIGPGGYWEAFQSDPTPWAERDTPWKWMSSFCLSVPRELFMRHKGFHPGFDTYGFEDAELGYRLWQETQKWSLMPDNCFHIYQDDSHSEYKNSLQQRDDLFRRSCEFFFRLHPVAEVREQLRPWLDYKE